MCLTLFAHYCYDGHETRPLCILNPMTDCTVFNPYAEPARNPCPVPCSSRNNGASSAAVSVNPEDRCAWHGDCCRLVRTPMCGASEPSQCPNNVVYHLRREPGTAEENGKVDDLSLLNEEPWFVALRWDFYQAGTDLHSLGARRSH
ncbi:hypothetical protein PG994_006682 [Apiospora phragmitis]|uniref:Uncharacterized protein n=1 Tax=Apiospora phragmitis TaxID=2905665 RepID=A0ABR1VFP5_9PEZI